jgi:hypothetical protein
MNLVPLLVPAGNDTEVQFNDSQLFAGDSTFTFNKTTKVLTTSALEVTNDANVGGTITATRLLIGS